MNYSSLQWELAFSLPFLFISVAGLTAAVGIKLKSYVWGALSFAAFAPLVLMIYATLIFG